MLLLDICDRNEISKTRRQANLLKRKVLSAGSIVGKPQKDKGERLEIFVLSSFLVTMLSTRWNVIRLKLHKTQTSLIFMCVQQNTQHPLSYRRRMLEAGGWRNAGWRVSCLRCCPAEDGLGLARHFYCFLDTTGCFANTGPLSRPQLTYFIPGHPSQHNTQLGQATETRWQICEAHFHQSGTTLFGFLFWGI